MRLTIVSFLLCARSRRSGPCIVHRSGCRRCFVVDTFKRGKEKTKKGKKEKNFIDLSWPKGLVDMEDKGDIFEVVVSGVGGKFPMSDNIEDLRINLNNKLNMVTGNDCRWNKGTPQSVIFIFSNTNQYEMLFFPYTRSQYVFS